MTNGYGLLKNSVGMTPKDERPKAPAGVEIGKPAHAGLGAAHKGPAILSLSFQELLKLDYLDQDWDIKPFSDTWLTTINETARNALIFTMEDFYGLEDVYDGDGNRIKAGQPSYQFQARQIGLRAAIHNCYPWTDPPMRKAEDSQAAFDKKMDKMLDKRKATPTRFEELVEDVKDGLENFEQRKTPKGRVELIDDYWIYENGIWRMLKHKDVIDGRTLAIKDRDGNWETLVGTEGDVQEMWNKVNNPKRLNHPALKSLNDRAPSPVAVSAAKKVGYPEMFQRVIGGQVVNCL